MGRRVVWRAPNRRGCVCRPRRSRSCHKNRRFTHHTWDPPTGFTLGSTGIQVQAYALVVSLTRANGEREREKKRESFTQPRNKCARRRRRKPREGRKERQRWYRGSPMPTVDDGSGYRRGQPFGARVRFTPRHAATLRRFSLELSFAPSSANHDCFYNASKKVVSATKGRVPFPAVFFPRKGCALGSTCQRRGI